MLLKNVLIPAPIEDISAAPIPSQYLEIPVEILDESKNVLHTAEVSVESSLYNIYGRVTSLRLAD